MGFAPPPHFRIPENGERCQTFCEHRRQGPASTDRRHTDVCLPAPLLSIFSHPHPPDHFPQSIATTPAHAPSPPLPLRGQLLVRLVAGICGAGGLGLLTWALARQSMDPAMRLASVGAGLGLVASAVLC